MILQKVKAFWSALSIVLTCLYPCAFLYAHNVEEAPLSSIFPFFCLFLLNALGVWLVLLVILRRPCGAGFLTDLVMLVVINFSALLGFRPGCCWGFWGCCWRGFWCCWQ